MGNYHLSYKDHNIWITVNNGKVEHYGATVNEATKEITCWIPSDNGKVTFWVVHIHRFWAERTSMGLSGLKIFVDGKHCESTICDKNSAYDNLGFVSYYVLPRGKVAPLHFSLADEEATQDFSAAQQSSVGEITVVVEKLQTMEPGRIVPSPDWLSKGFYKEPEYSMSEHNYL
ncbi:hypothetical protein CVT26_003160 [Gymnopilus dilepis]|uniref:Uncharacterized protein n=1 Tax=Gymnopilus dilepis TaxID=231916 RepID=A0A409X166_9AGAR|nr:hypothetical protein CVT26_003160 [Gymnopilus dilepis]